MKINFIGRKVMMNSNDLHYLKEWIREKNARSLKHKIRLEKIRNELKQKKEKDNDKKGKYFYL